MLNVLIRPKTLYINRGRINSAPIDFFMNPELIQRRMAVHTKHLLPHFVYIHRMLELK